MKTYFYLHKSSHFHPWHKNSTHFSPASKMVRTKKLIKKRRNTVPVLLCWSYKKRWTDAEEDCGEAQEFGMWGPLEPSKTNPYSHSYQIICKNAGKSKMTNFTPSFRARSGAKKNLTTTGSPSFCLATKTHVSLRADMGRASLRPKAWKSN